MEITVDQHRLDLILEVLLPNLVALGDHPTSVIFLTFPKL